MKGTPFVSVVIPEYRGEGCVQELVARVGTSIEKFTDKYEIILVNDDSPDNVWAEIEKICKHNPRVIGLSLSRNFGQHNAITAGLNYAKGEWIVIMDCDLQDIPEEIPGLYDESQKGFDIVYARRAVKHVGWWKRFSSTAFHKTLDWLSGSKTDPAIGNFGIYHRKVVDAILTIPQQNRGLQTLLSIVGFKSSSVEVEQAPSARGESSYTWKKLFKHAFDIILSCTNKPLRIAVGLGLTMSIISFMLALYNVIAKWVGIIELSGYTTTVFSIWFVGGLLMLIMGILGLYIGKIFDQSKGLPIYIVGKENNAD